VRDRLLLFDLGYFRYQLFSCIDRNGGYFLTRLKGNAAPLMVVQHRVHRGRARSLVGQRVRTVVAGLKRQILDIEVSVPFPRRVYGGRRSRATQHFRVVDVFDHRTRAHHLYFTKIAENSEVQMSFYERTGRGTVRFGEPVVIDRLLPGRSSTWQARQSSRVRAPSISSMSSCAASSWCGTGRGSW
jgi:hypothetical protein